MRPAAAHVSVALSSLALFAVAGGPAIAANAARMITGKQIRNSSVTGIDVRNGSLTAADFKKGALVPAKHGAAGPKGETGPRGAAGEPGPTGATGGLGAAGAKGDPGAAGPAGPKGDQGVAGASGDAGAQGVPGPKGETGAVGPSTGPAGGALSGSYPNPGLAAAESWHAVGGASQPPFAVDVGFPGYAWSNSQEWPQSSAAFYKDPYGVVHLKGKVRCVGNTCPQASLIFQLPAAYRPTTRHIFMSISAGADGNGAVPARLNVDPDGWVDRTSQLGYTGWLSLDGVSFRAG